jgi:hypothetical protein
VLTAEQWKALKVKETKLGDALMTDTLAGIGGRERLFSPERADELRAEQSTVRRLFNRDCTARRLRVVVQEAPALGRWLLRQDEEFQAQAVCLDRVREVLGPELMRKVEAVESIYTWNR